MDPIVELRDYVARRARDTLPADKVLIQAGPTLMGPWSSRIEVAREPLARAGEGADDRGRQYEPSQRTSQVAGGLPSAPAAARCSSAPPSAVDRTARQTLPVDEPDALRRQRRVDGRGRAPAQ